MRPSGFVGSIPTAQEDQPDNFFHFLVVDLFGCVSWPVIAGTQFTTYMALLNISGIAGTKLAGEMGDSPDYTTIYLGAGIAQIAFLLLLKKIDVGETRRELGESE